MRRLVVFIIFLSNVLILSTGTMTCVFGYDQSGIYDEFQNNDPDSKFIFASGTAQTIVIDDQLDQQQYILSGYAYGVSDKNKLAQSFVPTLNVLTRIQLNIFRAGNPESITISIHSDLSNNALTTTQLDADIIPTSSNWISFDIDDIAVNPGQQYYIIWQTTGSVSNMTTIFWNLADRDPYEPGDAWIFREFWEKFETSSANDPDFCFKTYGLDNNPPETPTKPIGPSAGSTGSLLRFESNIGDPNGDPISVLFDWDDGSQLHWIDDLYNGTIEQYHSWTENGTYHVTVIAKDPYHTSSWSEPLIIVIGNKAPNKPEIPVGPSSGKPETAYSYTSSATDPDGHRLFYKFNWDDGSEIEWMGPFDSGQEVSSIHVWKTKGTYSVKVKVCDDPNGDGDPTDGIESVWSDPLEISMGKSKFYEHPPIYLRDLFEYFLSKY